MKPIETEESLRRYQVAGFLSMILMVGVLGGWSVFVNISGAVIAPAEALIQTSSRTPLSFLIKPLTDRLAHVSGGVMWIKS